MESEAASFGQEREELGWKTEEWGKRDLAMVVASISYDQKLNLLEFNCFSKTK